MQAASACGNYSRTPVDMAKPAYTPLRGPVSVVATPVAPRRKEPVGGYHPLARLHVIMYCHNGLSTSRATYKFPYLETLSFYS